MCPADGSFTDNHAVCDDARRLRRNLHEQTESERHPGVLQEVIKVNVTPAAATGKLGDLNYVQRKK